MIEMDNASLINWFVDKLSSIGGATRYTTIVDYKDLISGKITGLYSPTQDNKPSPASPYTFSSVTSKLSFDRSMNVKMSFVGWTNSMEPTFDDGDVAILMPYADWKKQTGTDNLIGEIAVYLYGPTNMRIIHRVIGKDASGRWIFKGDNNFVPDAPVRDEQVVDVLIGILYTKDKLLNNQD